jgi:hypothetical protein
MSSKTTRPSKIVPRMSGDTGGTGKRLGTAIKSTAIRDSAAGEQCTFQIAGVCNGGWSTTVLCHLPDESHGIARKADDLSSGYGCSACHDVIDGRAPHHFQPGEKEWYMRRANIRTLRRMRELGLLIIKGVT